MITDADLAQTMADFHENSRYRMRRGEASIEVTNACRRWIRSWETDAEPETKKELREAQDRFDQIRAEGPPRELTA